LADFKILKIMVMKNMVIMGELLEGTIEICYALSFVRGRIGVTYTI
jgi:hypothetical protein